jgi:predicted ATPase
MQDPILGRDAELRAIEAFLDRVDDGPALLAFEGSPGIGKTTLLRATVEGARERGMRVLSCSGAVAETRLSYVGLTDLLTDVDPGHFAALPAPQLAALDAALLRADAIPSGSSWEAVATALRSLLSALSHDGPLVLVIDDLQWLDSSTARVVEFSVRRISGQFGIAYSRRLGDSRAQ